MHAAFAIQVALAQRDATGEGVLVEAPLIESALNIAAEQVVEYSAYGNLLTRSGNRSPGHAPQGVYLCRGEEQWLALSVETDEQWAGLRAALGQPSWASGADLSSYEGRRAAADRLDAELARWAADQDLSAAVDALLAHGVPAAELADFRAMSTHPLLQAPRASTRWSTIRSWGPIRPWGCLCATAASSGGCGRRHRRSASTTPRSWGGSWA